MSSANVQVLLLLSCALGIFALLCSLGALLCREWVKDDLRARHLSPLSVSWRPFGCWGAYYSCRFVVRYVDVAGLVHKARCWTGGFKRGVTWSSDEIVSNDAA
jgi:hypothetical protein